MRNVCCATGAGSPAATSSFATRTSWALPPGSNPAWRSARISRITVHRGRPRPSSSSATRRSPARVTCLRRNASSTSAGEHTDMVIGRQVAQGARHRRDRDPVLGGDVARAEPVGLVHDHAVETNPARAHDGELDADGLRETQQPEARRRRARQRPRRARRASPPAPAGASSRVCRPRGRRPGVRLRAARPR